MTVTAITPPSNTFKTSPRRHELAIAFYNFKNQKMDDLPINFKYTEDLNELTREQFKFRKKQLTKVDDKIGLSISKLLGLPKEWLKIDFDNISDFIDKVTMKEIQKNSAGYQKLGDLIIKKSKTLFKMKELAATFSPVFLRGTFQLICDDLASQNKSFLNLADKLFKKIKSIK